MRIELSNLNTKNRRNYTRASLALTFTVIGALISGPSLAAFTQEDATELGAESTAALATFKGETSEAQTLLDNAKVILICPKTTKGGFIVGIEGGKCEMRVGGEVVGYHSTRAAKVGLLAGLQSYSLILVFNDQAALDTFRAGDREWEIGVDASVAVAKKGATGKLDTTNLQEAIVAFVFGEKGLMADLSLEGSNFKKLEIE